MALELRNATQTFRGLIKVIPKGLNSVFTCITMTKHQQQEGVFRKLSLQDICIKPFNCAFGVTSLGFIGYRIDCQEMSALPDEIKAIHELSRSHEKSHRFSGIVNYLHYVISKCGSVQQPLAKMLCGNPVKVVLKAEVK